MKRTITTLILATTLLTANAQKKSPVYVENINIKDTAKAKPLTDSTYFLNLKTIDKIMGTKKSMISVADWEIFYGILNRMLLPEAIKEWEENHKPKK